MRKNVIYKILAHVAVLAVLASTIVALTHNHREGKPGDETHCKICLATHGNTSAAVSPTFTLPVVPALLTFVLLLDVSVVYTPQCSLTRGRAPPLG